MPKTDEKQVTVNPDETQQVPSEEAKPEEVIEEAIEEAADEQSETDETSELDGESSSTEEVADPEEDDGEEELEKFLDEGKDEGKKTGVQKRIDQLTAQIKQLKEKNDELESTVTQSKNKKPKYTKEQLARAIDDGIAKNDSALVMEVIDYMVTDAKDSLRNEYLEEQKKAHEASTSKQREWSSILQDYSYLWDGEEELYPNSSKELNLQNANSLLYRLATKLFVTEGSKYNTAGGQKQAVMDALSRILKKKRIASKDSKVLERRLAKAKRKTSLSSGRSSKKTEPQKPKTAKSALEEYISERKKSQHKAKGAAF